MYLILLREAPCGKAVHGTLYNATRTSLESEHTLTPLCRTLENADHLIPALTYRLTITHSPKFGRPLPLVNQVPRTLPATGYRTGIRFHPGSRPEHSQGCILLPNRLEEDQLTALLRADKENYLEIR